ncbi:MAG TPA: hypothetical protein VMM56_03545 [Planctomycetaceae bacterium]|nr:hypothetical protein [Planctomycetaceae bacterium]
MRTQIVTWIERSLLVIVLFVLGAIFFPTPRPTSAEIRLDTGDLRYLRGDQVVKSREMEEPYRSTLLSIAGNSPALKAQWHLCSNNPSDPERNTDKRCQRFYRYAATWLIADREIGLWVAEDVARYIETTDGQISQPDCYPLLVWVQKGPDGTLVVLDGWQNDEQVKQYLSQHGIRK